MPAPDPTAAFSRLPTHLRRFATPPGSTAGVRTTPFPSEPSATRIQPRSTEMMYEDCADEPHPRTIPRNTPFARGVPGFARPDRFDGASWRGDGVRVGLGPRTVRSAGSGSRAVSKRTNRCSGRFVTRKWNKLFGSSREQRRDANGVIDRPCAATGRAVVDPSAKSFALRLA